MAVILVALLSTISGCTLAGSHAVTPASESSPKISPELSALYHEYSSQPVPKRQQPFRSSNVLVRIIDDRVLVDAVASGDVNALKEDLVELGLREGVSFGRMISGQLPISSIPSLGKLSSLRFARASAATTKQKPLSPTTPER